MDTALQAALAGLQPGDALLYSGRGLFSRAIKIKTWSPVSHVEGYVGDGVAIASRDGVGVGRYPLRTDGLYAVLRPIPPFDLAAAMAWFQTVDGYGYDWIGLFAFFLAERRARGATNDKMHCAECLTSWHRAGGVHPFTPYTDAVRIAPGEYLKTPVFTTAYLVASARRAMAAA